MEADWGAHFDDVSVFPAIALVGYINPPLPAEGDGSRRPVDRADERGRLGVRLPHSTQWRPLHYCDVFVSDERMSSGHRLSAAGSSDPEKLRNRAACTQADFGTCVCSANCSRNFRDAALCTRTFSASASVRRSGAWRGSAACCSSWHGEASGTERSPRHRLSSLWRRRSACRMACDGKPQPVVWIVSGHERESRCIGSDERLQRRFASCCDHGQHLVSRRRRI